MPRPYVGKKAQKAEGKAVIKRRTFVIDRPIPDGEALRSALLRMMGVREVEISGTRLTVTYDLLEATAAQIEGALLKAGVGIGSSWGQRLKRGWVRYTEETELENLSAGDAPCCNRPPRA